MESPVSLWACIGTMNLCGEIVARASRPCESRTDTRARRPCHYRTVHGKFEGPTDGAGLIQESVGADVRRRLCFIGILKVSLLTSAPTLPRYLESALTDGADGVTRTISCCMRQNDDRA